MASRHYFRCTYCGKHMTYITEHEMMVQPGRTHSEALEEGAVPTISNDPGGQDCIGTITYCAGYDVKSNRACVPSHRGSERVVVAKPPSVNPDWVLFSSKVSQAWTNFVNSGYSVALRGANNHREYRTPSSVQGILQKSGGVVEIDGGVYIVSNSLHAGVSLHRSIPGAHQVGNIRSFIFHL